MNNIIFYLFIFISMALSQSALAFEGEAELKRLIIKPGVEFESRALRRGFLIYDKPVIHPLIDFGIVQNPHERRRPPVLYWPSFHLSMNEASLSAHLAPLLRATLGLDYFFGRELLELFGKSAHLRRSIEHSLEAFARLDFRALPIWTLSASTYLDLLTHQGLYSNFASELDLWKFERNEKCILLVLLDAGLGLGDSKHNRYLYGEGSSAGLSDMNYGLSFVFPKWLWDISSSLSVTESSILGENRSSSHTEGNRDHMQFQIRLERPFRL